MARPSMNDLDVFIVVGREGNFTRAASKLGVSPSAVSQTIRGLEERLGVRLLTRTTRSVNLTQAGERLLTSVAPMLEQIEAQLADLRELREKPVGTIRLTADEHAIRTVLWPTLRKVLPDYPDINLEITMDYALTDIVAERYDAGVRSGGLIAKDMIAVPIGPAMRGVTVASPRYLGGRKRPETPQDLTAHRCIKLHLPTYGGLPPWGYKKGDQELRVRVEGQLVFNSINPILEAALDGFGLAQLPDALVQPLLDRGDLVEVLADYSQRFPGYHLYYPSRRQPTAAFRVIVEALRYRGP